MKAAGTSTFAETKTIRSVAATSARRPSVCKTFTSTKTGCDILFAAPSCRLILLSPADFIDQFYWSIASLRGIAYHELFGELTARGKVAGHNDFRVDPARVEAMIAAALGEGVG